MSRFSDPRARLAIAFVATAVMTQFVFPGTGSGRGTPSAILANGLVFGMLNALTAAGIVLIYRTSRIINFAQAAMGAAGGELTFQFLLLTNVPFPIAFVLGVVLAALVGVAFELAVIRRFFRAPRLVLMIATIAVARLLADLGPQAVQSLPFFPETGSLESVLGTASLRDSLPFREWRFEIGGLPIPFGFPEVFAVVIALIAVAGLGLFLRMTRTGVAVRAIAENLDRASLLGIGTGVISATVWTVAGLLSGIGTILLGILSTPGAARGAAPAVLLPALAAAVLARMESLPTAIVASVLLSVLRAAFLFSFRQDTALVDLAFFGVVAAGLFLQRRQAGRSETGGGVTFESAQEQRAIPHQLAVLSSIRALKSVVVTLGLVLILGFPFIASVASTATASAAALHAVVALSLLVLTGWGGQVSLGQYGFAAIGSLLTASLGSKVGLPFFLAIPVAVTLTSAVAAALGFSALRIRGLFLAVATFAFAVAAHSVLLNRRYFGWMMPTAVSRPRLLLLDFDEERSMYFLCVLTLIAVIALLANLRRSRFGRLLIASRENEANLETVGVSAVRVKVAGFALAGAIAATAGALLTYLLRGVPGDAFLPERSISVFLLSVLGGIGSIAGVLIGTFYDEIRGTFLSGPGLAGVLFSAVQPFAVLLLLYIEPTGLIGLVNRWRDGVLRIVAQRRQILVPSLFAEGDATALGQKLIPLAPPIAGSGLAALRVSKPFALPTRRFSDAALASMERSTAPPGPPSRQAPVGAYAAAAAAASDFESGESPAREAESMTGSVT